MPAVSNLYRPGGQRWAPDADSVNAPDGVLLRADNLVPDVGGTLTLRRGSVIGSTHAAGDVSTLHAVELANGVTQHCHMVDDTLYVNDVPIGSFDGTGDLAIGNDSYQVFVARGTTKKKWDGTHYNNWGVTAPTEAPVLTAVASVTSTVADFNTGESPALTAPEGTIALTTDYAGTGSAAQTLTPDASTSRGVVQKLWTSDQDFFNISGVEGTETDLFDVYLRFSNPRDTESVEVIFGADNSSTAPFTTDRFEFKFDLTKTKSIPTKDFEAEGYGAYGQAVSAALAAVRPEDVTGIKTPEQVKAILAAVGSVPSPTSAPPTDSTAWGHLTVTRGQFKRVGNTTARGWDTIRGFKIVLNSRKGTTASATFADAVIIGGGARTLTGTFRCVIQAVRNFGTYYELSPPSPPSEPINLNHQTLQIQINGTTITGKDPQTDVYWVYLFGGWLDTWYRFAVVPASVNTGMSIDELTTPSDNTDLETVIERARIPSWGFTYCQLNSGGVPDSTASSDLTFTLRTSEMDALVESYKLDPYLMGPPDNIVGIAGSWKRRMFVLTSEGYVYPSSSKSPSVFNSLQVIDLTRYGNPKWITTTGNGVYVGMEKDVVFIAGTGDDVTDAAVDLYPQPCNVGNPPVDACHWVDGNSVIYRAADGPVMLTGSSIQPIPFNGTSLLWRGQTRHGVPALNTTTGRFRVAADGYMLYLLAPEGDATTSNVIYRYSLADQQWSRLVYAQVEEWHSILTEPDGTLIAGDNAGRVWTLESGEQDNLADIAITLLAPISDGGAGLSYKDAIDFQIHCNTFSDTLTASIYKDGSTTSALDFDVRTTAAGAVFRGNASSLGRFLRAQLGLTGTCSGFIVYGYNLTYRVRPQHTMVLDTGYFTPEEPGDMLWLYEVELDAIAAADVLMALYINDALRYTAPVPISTTGVRDVHQIPIPRGTKGERLRLVFSTTSADGEGALGFDPYSVRVRASSSGNQHERRYLKVYPVGSAP